jgi:hypothetical protein
MEESNVIEMDEETRERLRKVLHYMVESEAKTYWLRCRPNEREGWPYESALVLMRQFGFQDLIEADARARDGITLPDEGDEPDPADWWKK